MRELHADMREFHAFPCNSRMSVCFLTRASCKKVRHESYTSGHCPVISPFSSVSPVLLSFLRCPPLIPSPTLRPEHPFEASLRKYSAMPAARRAMWVWSSSPVVVGAGSLPPARLARRHRRLHRSNPRRSQLESRRHLRHGPLQALLLCLVPAGRQLAFEGQLGPERRLDQGCQTFLRF